MSTAVPVIPTYDIFWEQGADLVLRFTYLAGTSPVNLTGYNVRMDLTDGTTRLYTFNSADVTDIDPEDDTHEATVGSDGSINIVIPRAVSLIGPLFDAFVAGKTVFLYDLFLRDNTNLQTKILAGTVTVHKSQTLWT